MLNKFSKLTSKFKSNHAKNLNAIVFNQINTRTYSSNINDTSDYAMGVLPVYCGTPIIYDVIEFIEQKGGYKKLQSELNEAINTRSIDEIDYFKIKLTASASGPFYNLLLKELINHKTDFGEAPISVAAKNNDITMMLYLSQWIKKVPDNGALYSSILGCGEFGHPTFSATEWIIRNHKPNLNIYQSNKVNNTPLHHAIEVGRFDIAIHLLINGVNPMIEVNGCTAMNVFKKNKSKDFSWHQQQLMEQFQKLLETECQKIASDDSQVYKR